MVVRHVACLAHAHGVQKAIGVPAPRRILVSSELPVARWAHVLGIVLPVGMRAHRHWLGLLPLEVLQEQLVVSIWVSTLALLGCLALVLDRLDLCAAVIFTTVHLFFISNLFVKRSLELIFRQLFTWFFIIGLDLFGGLAGLIVLIVELSGDRPLLGFLELWDLLESLQGWLLDALARLLGALGILEWPLLLLLLGFELCGEEILEKLSIQPACGRATLAWPGLMHHKLWNLHQYLHPEITQVDLALLWLSCLGRLNRVLFCGVLGDRASL